MNSAAMAKLPEVEVKALEMTGQQVLNDLRNAQTMPFDTGNMQNDQTYVDDTNSVAGRVSIVTDAPQARRLYYHPEYNFQQGKNPHAGAGWFDPYIDGEKSRQVITWFKQFVRQIGGGFIK